MATGNSRRSQRASGNSRLFLGIGIGIAVAGAARKVAPAFRGLGRPIAKAAVKASLILLDRGRLQLAELKETVEDMAAEARAEMTAEVCRQEEPESPAAAGDVNATQSAYHA